MIRPIQLQFGSTSLIQSRTSVSPFCGQVSGVDIDIFRWIVVEDMRLFIVEPFAGGIEFLKDILDKTARVVQAHLPVVLPAPLVGNFACCRLTSDPVVVATPEMGVQGVDIAPCRIGPVGGSFGAEGVCCRSVIRGCIRIVVGIARHMLALAVDKQLVDLESGRSLRLHNPVAMSFPAKMEFGPPADNDFFPLAGGVSHGGIEPAGVFRGEYQRSFEIVYAFFEKYRRLFSKRRTFAANLISGAGY